MVVLGQDKTKLSTSLRVVKKEVLLERVVLSRLSLLRMEEAGSPRAQTSWGHGVSRLLYTCGLSHGAHAPPAGVSEGDDWCEEVRFSALASARQRPRPSQAGARPPRMAPSPNLPRRATPRVAALPGPGLVAREEACQGDGRRLDFLSRCASRAVRPRDIAAAASRPEILGCFD